MTHSPTVLEAKRFEIYACKQGASLRDACRQIASEDISCLAVTGDDGYLAGILTRSDLLRARLEHDDWLDRPVIEYMNREVITVTPEATLIDVARLLTKHHIHRVIIARPENGNLFPLGVISDSDLIYHMAYQIGF
jgi:CBS domain-containing protein